MLQAGQRDYQAYPVLAGDDAFFAMPETHAGGPGRTVTPRDREVLDAVRTQPNLAVVDCNPHEPDNGDGRGPGPPASTVSDHKFQPFQVSFRDPVSGKSGTVTVIGVLAAKLTQEWVGGIYTSAATYYEPVYGAAGVRALVHPPAGRHRRQGRRRSGCSPRSPLQGVQVKSMKALLDDSACAKQVAFSRMFQGFMALGCSSASRRSA